MTDTNRSTPPTLIDVAREAGVSLATASRSLNGSARKVNEEYRQRVLEAAARLNYSPNFSAQAVARGATTTVALLVADIADPYFSSIASGLVAEADRDGLIVTMAATERSPERELELVRQLRGQRPRVIILAGSRRTDEPSGGALADELDAYERAGGRVVLISRNEYDFLTVLVNNREGGEQLARELVRIGYRKFAVITAPELRTAADRIDGFRAGLAAAGGTLDDEALISVDFTRDGGYEGMRTLIDRGLDGVEAVFAANDVMAVGALSAVRDAGLVPGRDLAVAGYDDIQTVRDVTPPLTTVRIPLEELGRRALQLALDDPGIDTSAISTEVVLRESTPGIQR